MGDPFPPPLQSVKPTKPMPHDKNGAVLSAGDKVLIEAIVDSIGTGEDYCNCNLRTVIPMLPGDVPTTIVLNTRQCFLDPGLRPVADNAPAAPEFDPATTAAALAPSQPIAPAAQAALDAVAPPVVPDKPPVAPPTVAPAPAVVPPGWNRRPGQPFGLS